MQALALLTLFAAAAAGGSIPAPVAVSLGPLPHFEPHLAAHLTRPGWLFGAAMTLPEAEPAEGLAGTIVAGYRSEDGGSSWQRVELPGCRIDPWVAFGGGDRVYVVCMGRDQPLLLHRSEDGGRSFGAPTALPVEPRAAADRPVLAVRAGASGAPDRVHVAFGHAFLDVDGRGAYGVALLTSSDGGTSFAPPRALRHNHLDQQPFGVEALEDGSALVAFMDFPASPEVRFRRRTWLVRALPDGSFTLPTLAFETTVSEVPWSFALDRRYNRVLLAIDGAWQRQPRGGPAPDAPAAGAVQLVTSADSGRRWGPTVAVSDARTRTEGEVPAVAVNPNGAVAVLWHDTRHAASDRCFDLYLALSTDGGASFGPNRRLTPTTSCPAEHPAQRGIAQRWPYGGDYTGLAAGADGAFHALWADSRSGNYQLWSVRISAPAKP
jgi:hypothetical protein